eukprot:TRINITY_DN5522_c0_g1_i1.p1 TRINITY_DN5522_c0_g1~~TRINITY_DN5522_c0_g1_i1.p1  ORF type:complete len:553 (-),score=88.87 TRINITY_DN5522_c0_g1_i1:58-1716(-)
MDLPSLPPPPMELPLPPMDIGFLPPPIMQETPNIPESLPLPPTLPDLPSQPETDAVPLPLPPQPIEASDNIPPPIEDDWSTPIEGSEPQLPQEIEMPPPQIELTEEEKQAIEEKIRNDTASLIQAYVRTYHAVIDYEQKKTQHLFDSLTASAGPTLSSPVVGRARVARNNRRPPSRGHRAPGSSETPEAASTGENGAEGEAGENGETTPDKPRVRMMDGGRPMAMFDPTAVKLRTSSASSSDLPKKRPMSEEIPEFAKVNLRTTGNKPDEEAVPEEPGALPSRMASSGGITNKKKLDFKNRSRSSAPVGGFLLGKDISSASNDSFLPPPPPDSMISPGRQSPKSPSSSESMSLPPPSHLPPPSNLPPSHLPPPPGGMPPPPGTMPPPPPSGMPLPPSSMPPPLPQEPVDDAKKKKKEKVKNKLSKFFKTRVKKETLIQKGVLKEDPSTASDLPPPPGSALPPPLGSSLPPPPDSLPPPPPGSLPPPPPSNLPPGGLPPPLPMDSVNNCMLCNSDCSKKKDKKQCSKCNRIVCAKCIKKKGMKTKICLNCWKE